jgi:hypothetical protein
MKGRRDEMDDARQVGQQTVLADIERRLVDEFPSVPDEVVDALVSVTVRKNRQATTTPHVHDNMDAEEAQAVRAEGLDPDDPAVSAAIDLVRWELSLLLG